MAVSRRLMQVGCTVLATAGLAVALAAPPAGAGTGASAAVTRPTVAPACRTTVTVTESDDEAVITLLIGQTLVVSLPSSYQPPAVVPENVLVQRCVDGGYPTGRPLVVGFVAAAPGQATISTITDARCLHTSPRCAIPQRLWRIHIVVTV